MKGSVTIEASFIYPLILVLMFSTILLNFYIHDKVSTKANAYTYMVNSYFEDKNFDKTAYANSMEDFCFLSDTYTCSYNSNTKKLCIMDKYGHFFNVSFSSYERCNFIREYYCLIIQIISKASWKE